MGKYLQLTDLDGDSTSILKSAVVGVEVGTYSVEREIKPEPKPEPESTEPLEIPKALRIVLFPFRVAWWVLMNVGPNDPPPTPKMETVYLECSIVHVRAGNRNRKVRVKEAYREIMDQLD